MSTFYNPQYLMDKYNLRVVLLNKPYDLIENDSIQKLFAQTMCLKIKGYQQEYPYGTLAVGDYDYFSTHILICEKDSLKPIAGFKTVNLEDCVKFKRPFPIFGILHGNERQELRDSIFKIIDHAHKSQEKVAYSSSWTVDPEYRKIPEIKQITKDLLKVFFIKYYSEYNIKNLLAGAVMRFNIHKIKEFIGFDYLKDEYGQKLSSISCDFVFGEEVALMHLREPSETAKLWAKAFDSIWNQKLVIAKNNISEINYVDEIKAA